MKKTNTPATKNVATKSNTKATNTKAETKKDTTKKSVKKDTTTDAKVKEQEELNKIFGPEKSVKGKAKSTKAPKPAEPAPAPVETPAPVAEVPVKKSKAKKSKKVETPVEVPPTEVVTAKNGKTYKIDNARHTCKRIATSFEELDLAALNMDEMPMEVYQKYMRDRFPGEDTPIKKNKLFFKGFRISCSVDEGFKVEDTTKRYRVVELPFDGIPSPQELVDYLLTPKASADPKPAKVVKKKEEEKPAAPSVDIENPAECRKMVTKELARLSKKGEKIDIKVFSKLIPFARWQRTVRKFYKQFAEKQIRYPKLLQMITDYTKEESFVEQPKAPKYKFTGTILPEFTKVGLLVGDKLEVDGKKVDAVPFLVDYILHYVPKAMAQMMRWAQGAITDLDLLKSPFEADPFIEFNKKEFKQNKHNTDILSALCASVGIVAPQDMLFTDELQVGDKILLWDEDRWATKTITSTEEGIEYGRGVGVMKFDKWVKLQSKPAEPVKKETKSKK